MTSLDYARRLLKELTEDCAVPAVPEQWSRYTFADSNHVLIGDVAVLGYKQKGRWQLMERDVRQAAERLASVAIDHEDRVEIVDSASAERTWRSRTLNWLAGAGYLSLGDAADGCRCDAQLSCACALSAWDGPERETVCAQIEARSGSIIIASTRPLPLLAWSGTAWTVPRAYAALLDRAEEVSAQCARAADRCTRCGAADEGRKWRVSTANGHTTLCPSCTATVTRPYKGHLRGRMYASLPANARAEAFSCLLCCELRQAYYWDHCHDHGFVRGPLCPRCNTSEGGPGFLNRPGAVEHLLQCNGCRRERTVPQQHHPDIVRSASVLAPHSSCTHQPSACWGAVEEDGAIRFQLSCWQHTPVLEWEQLVPADEVRRLVKKFVDAAVDGITGWPAD